MFSMSRAMLTLSRSSPVFFKQSCPSFITRLLFHNLFAHRFLGTLNMTVVPPPSRLLSDRYIVLKRLLGPGPSNMPNETMNALHNPLLGHLHSDFIEIMDDVKTGMQYAFQTTNPLTFAVSGTGHAGMECAIMNLLEPGETILVVKNGIWGQRAADLSKRLGLNVKEVTVPEGEVVDLDTFKKAVQEHNPSVAFICHGESSTGVRHPLKGYGDACHANDCLLLVDTVASLGGTHFGADELKVDCVYSATQKVLNCPPGLAPISFSEKAVNKIRNRKTPVVSFYFDALQLGNYWGCFNEPRRYHHTAPISTVYALRESLSLLAKEGLDNVVNRHATNVKYLYEQLDSIGLKPFVKNPENRLPCLTTVNVPEGVDWKAVVDDLMQKRIEISGGLGPTVGRIWRIGTFGINSNTDVIDELVASLGDTLGIQKHSPTPLKAVL